METGPVSDRRVDDVVADLTRIVELVRARPGRLGVFPAMYRTVTRTVGEGLAEGYFDDRDRVERLVVTFADLYIDAFDGWIAGRRPPSCWALAFTFADRPRGSILQHLLLGMNAHINFDLGLATAGVATADELPSLEADFERVNDVLFALLDRLQGELDELSPWMHRIDRWGWGVDEACMRLGIRTARDRAWEFAGALTHADESQRPALTTERDLATWQAGRLLCHGLSPVHLGNRLVARRECRDPSRIIDELASVQVDLPRRGNTDGPGPP